MLLHPTRPDDDRIPVWVRTELWARAAAADRLSAPFAAPAVSLGPTDARRPASNFYLLQMGPQSRLCTQGGRVAELLQSECGFRALGTDWPGVRRWLPRQFRRFFPSGQQRLGWYSVLTARRPAQFRTDQDPAIRVTQDPATHYHLPHEDTLERHMELADLGGVPFARPEGATVSGTRMAVVHVPRLVTWSDPRFGLRRRYVERWACRARPVEDDELLTGGRVPAVPPAAYALPDGRPARVRDTVLLNLVKLDEPPGGGLWYDVLAVELHPQAGGVLTVRHSRMPLGAGILCSSPIEHAGMANTLYG